MHRFSLVLIILVGFFLSNCYEKKDGCLDIYATNFNAEADNNCCCQYPKIELNFSHQLNGKAYNATDTVQNDSGQLFKITSFSYYLSDIVFTDAKGNKYSTTDTFHIPVLNDYIVIKNDVALIRPGTTSVTLGSFKQLDVLKSITLKVGTPDGVDGALIDQIPDDRTLSRQADTLFFEGSGYASMKIKYSTNLETGIPEKTVYVYQRVPLIFSADLPTKIGSNTCLSVAVNYAWWFHDVNVFTDDESTVATKIIQNLQKSFNIQSCN